MMYYSLLLNNTFVLLVYSLSGVLVKNITGSRLAPWVPWGIITVHALEVMAIFWAASLDWGILTSLALVLPHGVLEAPALLGACVVGGKMTQGYRPLGLLLLCWLLLLVAAAIEVWVTPFPLQAWVQI